MIISRLGAVIIQEHLELIPAHKRAQTLYGNTDSILVTHWLHTATILKTQIKVTPE